jgi:hypothetical protein
MKKKIEMKYIQNTIKRYIYAYQCNKVKNTIKAQNVFCSHDFFEYIVEECLQNVLLYLEQIKNQLDNIKISPAKDEQFNQIYNLIKKYFVVSGVNIKEVDLDEANICQSKRNFNLITTEIINLCNNEYKKQQLMDEHIIHIKLYIAKLYATIIKKLIIDEKKPVRTIIYSPIIKKYIMDEYKARIQIMYKNYGKNNKKKIMKY